MRIVDITGAPHIGALPGAAPGAGALPAPAPAESHEAFDALCRHFDTTGRIDWHTGEAQLANAGHRDTLSLRFRPAGDGGAEDRPRQALALTTLIEGLADVLKQAGRWQTPRTAKLPGSFTLDADVLRVGKDTVIARRARSGSGWLCHIEPSRELRVLLRYLPPDALICDGAEQGYPMAPWPQSPAAQTTPASSTPPRRIVFQHWSHANGAAAIASKQPGISRLAMKSRLGAFSEQANPALQPRPAVSPDPARVRVTCVGGSSAASGESSALTLSRMTPAALVETVAAGLRDLAAPGGTPDVPSHLSLVSCLLDSPLVDADFGAETLSAATRIFGTKDLTVSVRTGAYAVDSRGRKLTRTPEGDFMHRAPGSVRVLSMRADGTIERREKYPDLGQASVWELAPSPAPLLAWLDAPRVRRPHRTPVGEPVVTSSTARSGEAAPHSRHWQMGELRVPRALLERMGLFAVGAERVTDAALGRLEAWRDLRFQPGPLVDFLASDGGAPERLLAMRLLKQLMRNGVSAASLFPGTGTPPSSACVEACALLQAVDAAIDDGLHVAPALWTRLWAPGAAPALPHRATDVSAFDS